MTLEVDDRPRSMRDPAVRARRRAMLGLPHIAPLSTFVSELRTCGGEVPDFDPLDGGIEAKVLFLFEKPGPMTAQGNARLKVGSGFISRNNDDQTAEATFRFMKEAAVPRQGTVAWNLVPAWNGVRKVTSGEIQTGLAHLSELLRLLPRLRAAVLVGKQAQKSQYFFETTGLKVLCSAHPSPLVRARHPDRWRAIPADWAKVRPHIV
jgi:hypothetical protein